MKLLIAVVLAICAAQAYADCGPLQRFRVKHQWQEAFGSAHHRVDFGAKFWTGLFHDHPEARDIFKSVNGENVYSAEFSAHSARVLGGLEMVISLLDDQATLDAELAHLKGQHDARGIKAEMFDAFREELLTVLPTYLGTKLDYAAWKDCFNLISGGMH